MRLDIWYIEIYLYCKQIQLNLYRTRNIYIYIQYEYLNLVLRYVPMISKSDRCIVSMNRIQITSDNMTKACVRLNNVALVARTMTQKICHYAINTDIQYFLNIRLFALTQNKCASCKFETLVQYQITKYCHLDGDYGKSNYIIVYITRYHVIFL